MTLKPAPARWFELLTDREALGPALRALALTATVELESHSSPERPVALPDYAATLAEFSTLARRYHAYWPTPRRDPDCPPPDSIAGAEHALAEIRSWAIAAEPTLQALQEAGTTRSNLAELAALLAAAEPVAPLLQLARCTRLLSSRLFALGEPRPPLPPGMLAVTFTGPRGNYLAALATDEDCATLDHELASRHARRLDLPAELPPETGAACASLATRIATLDQEIADCRAALAELEARHQLAARLAGFAFLEWLVANVPRLPATEHFAWVTGWTSDRDGRQLEKALEDAGLPHLLHYPEPPIDAIAPVVFANHPFLKPFEIFVRLIGTPRANDADPTLIVALLAPLLFGIMFADVAQGLLLVGVGAMAWRQVPALRLLVPGGLCATIFGLLFGSVAAREDLLQPLWLRPLEAPLRILSASIVIGATVISVGLLIDALAHLWRAEGRRWLLQRGGLVLAYLGLLLCLVTTRAAALVCLGTAWLAIGPFFADRRTVGATIGDSIETLMQLLVNTISFARVGAFALAHAGLSAAIIGIADATGGGVGFWIALVLGNLLIVIVEGVVVGIQTTRLVLFEFFIRFLHADGRPLRPLAAPPGAGSP